MFTISSNAVLPSNREPVEFVTSDSLTLVGELATPQNVDGSAPDATIVCVHPLPTQGGMMDSHIFRKMSWRLPAMANIAVLRFNTRGTTSARGTSEGHFDHAVGEGKDLAAAIDFALGRGLTKIWVVGWSFGTDVILKNIDMKLVAGVILLSPPLRYSTESDLVRFSHTGKTIVALVPEFDDFLRPDDAREKFAIAEDITVMGVAGAKHLWVGEKFVYQVLNRITEIIAPAKAPLPREWPEEFEKFSDLS